MGETYIFDNNIIVSIGQRHYPQDLFASFWEDLGELMDDNTVLLSDGVLSELSSKLNQPDEDRNEWRKWWINRKASVEEENHQESYAKVVTSCQTDINYRGNCQQSSVDRFLSGADPFLIAIAKDLSATIVSDESGGSLKIPTISNLVEVRCISLIDFLREMKFSFDSSRG